jgi:hypothetical protein
MMVTPEFVKKQLENLGKKERANEKLREEAQQALDKTSNTSQVLKYEAVALRTLAAGNIPKSARPAMAQQLAEVMGVEYNETSIMSLIAKYEKQDVEDEISVPVGNVKEKKAKVQPAEVITVDVGEDKPASEPKRGRGRPPLTPEQKAKSAKKRALAAQEQAKATVAVDKVEEEPVSTLDDDDDDEEYFDPSDYDDE